MALSSGMRGLARLLLQPASAGAPAAHGVLVAGIAGTAAARKAAAAQPQLAEAPPSEPRWLRELGVVRNDWTCVAGGGPAVAAGGPPPPPLPSPAAPRRAGLRAWAVDSAPRCCRCRAGRARARGGVLRPPNQRRRVLRRLTPPPHVRRRDEVAEVFNAPLLDLVYRAAHVHRQYNDPSMARFFGVSTCQRPPPARRSAAATPPLQP
jgi:hypothetical protein